MYSARARFGSPGWCVTTLGGVTTLGRVTMGPGVTIGVTMGPGWLRVTMGPGVTIGPPGGVTTLGGGGLPCVSL